MPIFEYHCDCCGKDFEQLVQSGEQATECRLCGGADIKRRFSRFSTRTDSYTATDISATSSSGCGGCSSGNCATCGG